MENLKEESSKIKYKSTQNNYLDFLSESGFPVPDVLCKEFAGQYFRSLFRRARCMWEG